MARTDMKGKEGSREASEACGGDGCGKGTRTGRIVPGKTFSVPDAAKCLDTAQLEALTKAFRSWAEGAAGPGTRLARGRVWLIYLVLRYTGAKLGEVLNLDDQADIDLASNHVVFGGNDATSARKVSIPATVAAEIASFLFAPAAKPLHGKVFKLDQGHVRKKFYERAKELALPQELSNPSVLRRSRAVELLRENVPLTVVQSILGHSSASLTATYVDFSEEAVERIVGQFIQKEAQRKTSARNSFPGKVARITRGDIQAEVEVTTPSGNVVYAIITTDSLDTLGLVRDTMVTAIIKAPVVLISKDEGTPKTSARNKFQGVITKLIHGKVVSDVTLEISDGTLLHSIMSKASAKQLKLRLGESAWAMFKAFSVILNVD